LPPPTSICTIWEPRRIGRLGPSEPAGARRGTHRSTAELLQLLLAERVHLRLRCGGLRYGDGVTGLVGIIRSRTAHAKRRQRGTEAPYRCLSQSRARQRDETSRSETAASAALPKSGESAGQVQRRRRRFWLTLSAFARPTTRAGAPAPWIDRLVGPPARQSQPLASQPGLRVPRSDEGALANVRSAGFQLSEPSARRLLPNGQAAACRSHSTTSARW
jgi:hypothetical protein